MLLVHTLTHSSTKVWVMDKADRDLQAPRTQPATVEEAVQLAVYKWSVCVFLKVPVCLWVLAYVCASVPASWRPSREVKLSRPGAQVAVSAPARMWLFHTLLCVTSKSASPSALRGCHAISAALSVCLPACLSDRA